MTTPAQVFIMGLCSVVNAENTPYLPTPAVVVHRADVGMPHTAFIAWEPSKVTLVNEASFVVTDLGNGFKYLVLDGDELILNDDKSKGPTPKSSYDDVARLHTYGKVANVLWDYDRVPKVGRLPEKDEAGAYLELGSGYITADKLTDYEYSFEYNGNVSVPKRKYARRVIYSYDSLSDNIIFLSRPLGGGAHRKLDFTKVAGPLEVWIGNSESGMSAGQLNQHIKDDLAFLPPQSPQQAYHFMYFYKSLADSNVVQYIPIPYVQNPPTGGGGSTSGYCGPDGQP